MKSSTTVRSLDAKNACNGKCSGKCSSKCSSGALRRRGWRPLVRR